ncbi:WD40-repeat-containing domain protein [Podospora fimiseda]|uniref:WD40-repeat-containing domain protein n=1 Tax=Podospora fimiseda TaxID=252190 RepID=A0AAN7BNM4_9PEZI|nr:WD40-repeat-containing domain protein [Podospora fimiseda]
MGDMSSSAEQQLLPSSPPRPQSSKERRNPSITPRKFRKFFTPRPRVSSKPSAARKALHDITAPNSIVSQSPSSSLKPISEEQDLEEPELPGLENVNRPAKRRKIQQTPKKQSSHLPSPVNTSPALLPTPELRAGLSSPIHNLRSRQAFKASVDIHDGMSEDEDEDSGLPLSAPNHKKLVPIHQRGLAGQLLQRMTGSAPRGGFLGSTLPVPDWRSETAGFYSRPDDIHVTVSHERANARSIPFCTTSSNRSGVIAVGDEEGYIRMLDTNDEFSKISLSFSAHGNAIIDMQFSSDDRLLATASGDQTGRVFDVATQTAIASLSRHRASLKQVRFQPGRGENCVLATTSRDGCVKIWDLRCKGPPVQDVIRHEEGLRHGLQKPITPGCMINCIANAHAQPARQAKIQGKGDVGGPGDAAGRLGQVSVTALEFLPAGREHLFVTGCEADASIKLWDMRAVRTTRNQSVGTPISYTRQPASHLAWRPFGISSLALDTNGSRLYALCKDNTVYAYSTEHLILGTASELVPALPGSGPPRRRPHGTPNEGLAPLYGFRHPMLHATSFYVKAALRPAANGRSEMLAVGSSDGCAVLFPTDERYIQDAFANGSPEEKYYVGETTACLPVPAGPTLRSGLRSGLARSSSSGNMFARQAPAGLSVPIVNRGTPLVRGHDKELGALTWTNEGNLVTVGDDFVARCWREDREEAADLRLGGEGEGRRWGCGWADVGDKWDGDEVGW